MTSSRKLLNPNWVPAHGFGLITSQLTRITQKPNIYLTSGYQLFFGYFPWTTSCYLFMDTSILLDIMELIGKSELAA